MSRRDQFCQLRSFAPAILPSLLLCDFGNLQREVERLAAAGVRGLHLDVMDGNFVPNLTYGMPIVAGLSKLTEMPLDVHLMIQSPEQYVDEFVEAGATAITVHAEATENPVALLQQISQADVAAGIAINPDTPVASLAPCVGHCDLVLIMSVQAGFGGQAFRTDALSKLAEARELFGPDVILEIDGGVNSSTIADCTRAGAELLVVGSAIFRADDYSSAVAELSNLAGARASSSN